MLKKLVVIFIFSVINLFCSAAIFKGTPSSSFPLDSLEMYLTKGINKIRLQAFIDTLDINPILKKASELQAMYMAKSDKAELTGSGKNSTTAKRIINSGGAGKGEEIVVAAMVTKGKANMNYKDVAELVLKKWKESKKDRPIVINGKYVYHGITAKMSEDGKKAYLSVVFGGYDIINDGAKKKAELKAPFSSKAKRVKPYVAQVCKSCEKFKDYDSLCAGLYVKDGIIYLKYHDLKALKRIMKKPSDGFAVDVVQLAQYEKPAYNILNNNLPIKGILIKPIGAEKLFKKNTIKEEKNEKGKVIKKVTELDAPLGKFPSAVKADYELNLLVLQNGKLCKTLTRTYIEHGKQTGAPFDMLLMPDSAAYLSPLFEPKSESGLLTFNVPFEKNKSDYKEEDMKPFLSALEEPDFIIEGIYITAYSSIEGDSISNAQLQKNRAKSIIDALKKFPQKEAMTNIKTQDS